MEIKGDNVIFSTGREQHANHGIIGISQGLSVFTGYDDSYFGDGLTKDEKKELAEFMIQTWQKFEAEI